MYAIKFILATQTPTDHKYIVMSDGRATWCLRPDSAGQKHHPGPSVRFVEARSVFAVPFNAQRAR